MPRSPDTYTLPPGTTPQAPNTVIGSAMFNAAMDDIAATFNTAWPVAIGVGAAGATGSWDAINAQGSDIASAGTINLTTATGPNLTITGATTITTVTLGSGNVRFARANAAFQLTASANLIINGSASSNYTTTAGDLLIFIGGSGSVTRVWTVGSSSTSNSELLSSPVNLGLAAAVASNALTISVKGVDGNDPSASNPVTIPFRNVTPGTGTPSYLTITAATSLVISSGSTLGAPTGSVPFKVWVVGFNDGGTFRLSAMVCTTLASGSIVQYPLASFSIASSTAEGGAGAADSAQTFYTDTAVTSKAYTVLGVLSFESGLATAGTWAAAPTRTQLFGNEVALPGSVVQSVGNQTGAVATGTTTVPQDDTVPTITEGDQYMTQAITPSSAGNILSIVAQGVYGHSSNGFYLVQSLFQDAVSAAYATTQVHSGSANVTNAVSTNHQMIAATTSATTFRIRTGSPQAGTTTFNGVSGSRQYGGVMNSFIRVTEIAA